MFAPKRVPRRGPSSETGRSGPQLITVDRLLYVEDNRLVRTAFVRAFTDYRVDVAGTLAEARARTERDGYLAWIVDERLPDGSGLGFVEAARARGVRTPVLLVTALEDTTLVNRAQLLGVEVAFKPEMSSNVRAFLGRARGARSAIAAVLRATDRFAEVHRLSSRERDLVRAVGRGVSRAALDVELGLSENTVKTLVRRILRKTGQSGLDEVLRFILSAEPEVESEA